jgi:hypothetical protein
VLTGQGLFAQTDTMPVNLQCINLWLLVNPEKGKKKEEEKRNNKTKSNNLPQKREIH